MTEVRPLRAYAEVALGRQRSPQHDSGPFMTKYLRAANVKDGFVDLTDVKQMNFDPKERVAFALAPGDVLVTEGSGSLGAVGASSVWTGELDGPVCFQNTLLRLRPRPSTDARFLSWWCRYAYSDGLFASIATGANIFHISADRVRALPMVYLPLEAQRAIADYLDTETTRIDALIAKKHRMIEVLDERRLAFISEALYPHGHPGELFATGQRSDSGVVPAKRLLQRAIAGGTPASDNSDYWTDPGEGSAVAWISIGDMVDRGRTVTSAKALTPAGLAACRLRPSPPGTLLFAMYASLGKTTVTTGSAVWNQAIVGLVPKEDVAEVRYLAYWLEVLRPHLGALARSSTQDNLNAEQVGELPVPNVPLSEQQRVVRHLEGSLTTANAVAANLRSQIDLLVEHRQALITAAVTGELSAVAA